MDFRTDIAPIIQGQVRHLATIGATALAAHGWLASSKAESFEDALVAAVMIVAAMAWSAAEKALTANGVTQKIADAKAMIPPDAQAQLARLAELVAASPKAAAFMAGGSMEHDG